MASFWYRISPRADWMNSLKRSCPSCRNKASFEASMKARLYVSTSGSNLWRTALTPNELRAREQHHEVSCHHPDLSQAGPDHGCVAVYPRPVSAGDRQRGARGGTRL